MAEGWDALITYALPPILGAVIGYVTNAIAIKMLFRPLRPVRVLGLTLPFTPGIIPRRRKELAESIGRMVSRELLTEESLGKRLAQPSFMEGLRKQVSLMTDLALTSRLDAPRLPGLADFLRAAEGSLRESLRGYLASPRFEEQVLRVVGGCADALFARTPEDLLGGEGVEAQAALAALLEGPLGRLFAGLGEGFARRFREGASPEALTSLSPPPRLEEALDAVYPAAARRLLEMARSDGVRRELAHRGRFVIRGVLAELSLVQRLIVGAVQYDRTPAEKMPRRVEDLLEGAEAALESGTVRRAVVAGAASRIRAFWGRPLRETAEGLGRDPEESASSLEVFIARLPETLGLPERLAAGLAGFLRRRRDRTLGEILAAGFGLSPAEAAARSAAFLASLVRKAAEDRIAAAPTSIADSFLRSLEGRTLGEALRLPEETKTRLDELLSRGVFRVLVKRLPGILSAFEVETLVRDRIDELDVAEVERLLLDVISRHLAYINLFGALLGFLIGGVQVVLMILR